MRIAIWKRGEINLVGRWWMIAYAVHAADAAYEPVLRK